MATKIIMNKTFWNGYKGYKGTTLDQTECELYDDIPAPSVAELTLQVLAGGQVAERQRRAMYYDTDEEINAEDIEEIDPGTGAEEFDYIQAYKDLHEKNIKYFKMKQELERQSEQKPEKSEQKPEEKSSPEK